MGPALTPSTVSQQVKMKMSAIVSTVEKGKYKLFNRSIIIFQEASF